MSETFVEQAVFLGRQRYAELALFRWLGRRAVGASDDSLSIYCQSASLVHGSHALAIEKLMPNGPGLADRGWTKSPGSEFDQSLVLLAQADDAEFAEGLVAVVYPALAASYRRHEDVTSPPGSGALRRTVARVLADTELLIAEATRSRLARRTGRASRAAGQLLAVDRL